MTKTIQHAAAAMAVVLGTALAANAQTENRQSSSTRLLERATRNAQKIAAAGEALERAPVRVSETSETGFNSCRPENPAAAPAHDSAPDHKQRDVVTDSPSHADHPAPEPKQRDAARLPNNSSLPQIEGQESAEPAQSVEVRAADPRETLPGETANPSVWEPTNLNVNRVFAASDGGDPKSIPMNVPVYYESRLLALDKDQRKAAAKFLEKLIGYQSRLTALKKEGVELLAEWNAIVKASTPTDWLMADSPTLVGNQGKDAVNRGEIVHGFEPGQGVEIALPTTTAKK